MNHNRDFEPHYGTAVEVAPGVRRITAENPGPFTFFGTNTYLLGTKRLIVVDPGPALPDHVEAIVRATQGAEIDAILVTHTHMDHSPGARLLQHRTGAPIAGCGPHVSARDLNENETNPLDASSDKDHTPDQLLKDRDVFRAAGMALEVVATPGHTMNHLCFALAEENILLSADHVMAWATSIVAPPDGNMQAYMASLDKLLTRSETVYLPGHGGKLEDALPYVRDLKSHRQGREAAVLEQLERKSRTIPEIVSVVYANVDPALHGAAGLSVFAHLEDLVSRGEVSAEPDLSLQARFRRPGPTG